MTQEEKNVLICEQLGWKFSPLQQAEFSLADRAAGCMCWTKPGNDPWQTEQLPNYFSDLNAMREALASLPTNHDYEDHLASVLDVGDASTYWWEDASYRFKMLNATAAQRAEAFGLTLGLWKEGD